MKRLMAFLNRHDGVMRVLRTFVYAFLGLAIPGLLGWLHDLTEWANSQGQSPFPDAHSLAFIGVAAISAGSIAVINALGIWLENATGRAVLRGSGQGVVKRV
jgi:hypothetical protein